MRARISMITRSRLAKLEGQTDVRGRRVLLVPPIETDHAKWEEAAVASQRELAHETRPTELIQIVMSVTS
jgi:hypothetical protein